MGLKGRSLIELTDVNTGETERHWDSNIITNAVTDLFNNNIEGMLFCVQGTAGASWADYHLPICPNAVGGILLFSDTLDEDEDNLYAPSANPCVGYASNDVNSTADEMRGSMNLTESGAVDGGYRFVWDFATSQGNGTISAIALTHKLGGVGYFGDAYDASSMVLCQKRVSTSTDGSLMNRYVDAAEVDFEGNCFWSISIDTSYRVVVSRIKKCFTQAGLNASFREDGDEVLAETVLSPSVFTGSYYADFHDGGDGYWYGFMCNGNSSGNATVRWIKISRDDCSYAEGTWTLEGVTLYQAGYRSGYGSSPTRCIYSAVRGGYIYFMRYDRTGLYKVALNNPADITLIELGFMTGFAGGSYGYLYMWRLGGFICGSDYIIDSDDSVTKTAAANPFAYTCTPLFQHGVYALAFGRYSYSSSKCVYKTLYLVTPYLASINNLGTSVIKTADRTMKITYTVTETDGTDETEETDGNGGADE